MSARAAILALADLTPGLEADFFALLSAKEELTTRDNKPYFKVTFRDDRRAVSFPIWADSPHAEACRDAWRPGRIYKLRAVYRETAQYGPQLDLKRVREAVDGDHPGGLAVHQFLPRTEADPVEVFNRLRTHVEQRIGDIGLRELTLHLLDANREALLALPAATRNHHAYVGGYLDHVWSVTENATLLAEKYARLYARMKPALDPDLVIAGAVLHDIGKLRELEWRDGAAAYSAAGSLIGHIVQGRDLVREAALGRAIDPEKLLRLEHVILSHQRLPEWGSPKPPMTPEALLVHFADDCDAKFEMMFAALRDDTSPGPVTSKKNTLYQQVYRGPDALPEE